MLFFSKTLVEYKNTSSILRFMATNSCEDDSDKIMHSDLAYTGQIYFFYRTVKNEFLYMTAYG